MNCPICSHASAANISICPNCQSNLAPLKIAQSLAKSQMELHQTQAALVKDLEEQVAKYEARLQKKNNTIGWMTISFLVLAGLSLFIGLL